MKKYNYKEMIDTQYAFNNRLFFNKGIDIDDLTEEDLHRIMKDYVLHIVDECTELLREINWKMHIPWDSTMDRDAIIEELVDIDKFHKNFLMILKITEDEFIEVWNRKTQKVFDKYKAIYGE